MGKTFGKGVNCFCTKVKLSPMYDMYHVECLITCTSVYTDWRLEPNLFHILEKSLTLMLMQKFLSSSFCGFELNCNFNWQVVCIYKYVLRGGTMSHLSIKRKPAFLHKLLFKLYE